MRTFQRGQDRFWNIDRKGTTITVAFGKVGGKPQVRKSTTKPESAAILLYQRMIREKLRDGYAETTPPPAPLDTTGQALESALVDNPDDTAAHMALADWLAEQPDPAQQARGEFIRLQLAQEKPRLSEGDRRKLQKKERALRKAHEHDWLGSVLADVLLDGGDPIPDDQPRRAPTWEYRRGWIDRFKVPLLTPALAAALDAPALRLLRYLEIEDAIDCEDPLAPLAKATNLRNVRKLTVGPAEFYDAPISDLVANLPRIEQLELIAPGLVTGGLFSLRNLGNLRELVLIDAEQYPIRDLAGNPALTRLKTLVLSPPGLREDDQPHLRLASIRALVRSKNLPALENLALHRSDMGDAGCREIADSGVLARLKSLDLTHGCVTDEGARILSKAKDYAHLKQLDLTDNRLTEEGIAMLKHKGLNLICDEQQQPDDGGFYDDFFLYETAGYAPSELDELSEGKE
jgi:uncharacterized protein (TIGR02996 family)